MTTDDATLFETLQPILAAVTSDGDARDLSLDAALTLRSIEVITLVDLLESTFGIVFSSEDVRPSHFASPRALIALLRHKGVR